MTVRDRIGRERARLRGLTVAAGAGAALALTALLLAVAVYLLAGARWIELPAVLPLGVWLLVAAGVAGAAWLTRRLARRDTDERAVAEAVEREQRLRAGALRGVLEVSGSGALARRAEERLAAQLDGAGGALAPQLRRRTARRGGAAATVGMLGVGALAFSASDAPDGWTVLAHPIRAMSGSLLPPLAVVDVPPAVMRGEPLELAVAAPGRRSVLVRHRATGGAWVTERLPVTDGRAVLQVASMDADLTVIATDGRVASDTVRVTVTDRPFLGNVSVTATFPAYLNRRPETLPLGEPALVPQGTELRLQGASTTELAHVLLAPAAGGDTLRLAVDGRNFAGRIVAAASGRWTWQALGAHGDVPHVPPPLELLVTPDAAPQVLIVSPGRDSLVLPTSRVPLALAASDDHGLGDVVLRAWRQRAGGEPEAERSTRLEPAGLPEWSGGAELSLAAYDLEPGDEVHVVVSATDQSPWRQTAQSRELVLRVATLAEQRVNARDMADSVVARALAAAAAQRSLAQRTEDASRARDRGNGGGQRSSGDGNGEQGGTAMSFESAERARALANEQRQLQKQVEQTREAARDLEQQLEQAGAMDAELQARMREVQQMLQDAITPEMAEQLRKLEQAAQRLSPEQTRQALGDLAQQQKALREQLERSVEMLRRAALEGAMETLRDEAQDLADAQQQLADDLKQGEQGERRQDGQQPQSQQQAQQAQDARQQARSGEPQPSSEELARRTEELAREVEALQQRLAQQKAEAGARRAGEAAKHSEASADAMREAARQQLAQGAERRTGEQQGEQGQQRAGERQGAQRGATPAPPQQGGEQRGGEQRTGTQQGQRGQQGQESRQGEGTRERPGGTPQQGGSEGGGRGGEGAQSAQQAADEMRQASEQLAQARADQVSEWKQDLSAELDRSISELQQLAREQQQLEQQARSGASPEELRAQQSAVQQGVQQTGQRLQEAGKTSSHVSQRSQQAVAQAQRQVQQAAQATGQSRSAQQAAPQMRSAADALNQAAASLARDRQRVNSAQSASGFSEQMAEMQQLAQQQGAISQGAASLIPNPGAQPSANAREQARRLSEQQRAVADRLEKLGDRDGSGRTDALAAEAERLAAALAGGALDQDVVNRQQRLFRRMLDAGRTLEKDEVDESGKREGESVRGGQLFTPSETDAAGRAARRFQLPTWNELRQLSPEERRLVLEYFRRLNAEPAAPAPTPPPRER